MRRRAFLAAAGLAAVSGCVAGYQGSRSAGPVPEADLERAAPRDAIPAITDPAFAPDWSDVSIDREGGRFEPRLRPDDLVIGVGADAVDGGDPGRASDGARAYPLRLLAWHEVVNDAMGGPLLVTYCPLCRSGLVARREVRGEPTTFGVSGFLLDRNLVMYDRRTESLWSQIAARAVRGPETGETLDVLPSSLTTWSAWRETHSGTEVLLPAPLSETVLGRIHPPYDFDLYERRAELEERSSLGPDGPGRLPARMLVVGVERRGEAVAYPVPGNRRPTVVNDEVGGLPVLVTSTDAGLAVYDRRLDGRVLSFEADPLRAGGSRFDPETGRALDGPLEGERLDPVPGATAMYWFAWHEFHPDTEVYGQ